MAGNLYKRLGSTPAYLASSATDVFFPNSSSLSYVITHIHVTNTDSSARTFTLALSQTLNTETGGTELASAYSLAATGGSTSSFDYYGQLQIGANTTDRIVGHASIASKVVVTIEGFVYPVA